MLLQYISTVCMKGHWINADWSPKKSCDSRVNMLLIWKGHSLFHTGLLDISWMFSTWNIVIFFCENTHCISSYCWVMKIKSHLVIYEYRKNIRGSHLLYHWLYSRFKRPTRRPACERLRQMWYSSPKVTHHWRLMPVWNYLKGKLI